ncbi:hypothetical protein QCB45_07500 [Thiomicrorhabdus sp. ZW0627]|uniref:hypothetical protein n=1 Tax=Thiomicrorhabdus sp. ZW0627 TaxID=3039774 RepID=UPI0024371311|nr:hypothetical protein [Thiomicrorhabdus sp. ZW0627]MDG6774173.1 hypothetical protein [Thiomicrorhabdus sp. ZW0627]
MKNTIIVKIPFHFKGELQEPSTLFDLDDWVMRHENELPDFPVAVAKANNISSYSYELEVMEMSEVLFEQPTGIAADFYSEEDSSFDFEGFKQHWLAEQSFDTLKQIAKQYLGEDLQKNSPMHQALTAAYIAGKQS